MINNLISVVIFAYNHEDYIARTIESVIDQKCDYNLKIYVCDDCSTDGTASIITNYYNRYKDLIIPVLNEANIGLNRTFYKVVQMLTSKYIAIIGGDDYWIRDDKLQLQVSAMEGNEEISYVHTEYVSYIEETGEYKKHQNANWRWCIKADSQIEKLSRFLSHKWTAYPLASSSCFRLSVLQEGLNNHPEILLNPFVVGEGTLIHFAMCYYGKEYEFLPVETTGYTVKRKSLSHFSDNKDYFIYQVQYAKLRISIADTVTVRKNKLVNPILEEVLMLAFHLKQTASYRDFLNDIKIPTYLKYKFNLLSYFNFPVYYYYRLKRKIQRYG